MGKVAKTADCKGTEERWHVKITTEAQRRGGTELWRHRGAEAQRCDGTNLMRLGGKNAWIRRDCMVLMFGFTKLQMC